MVLSQVQLYQLIRLSISLQQFYFTYFYCALCEPYINGHKFVGIYNNSSEFINFTEGPGGADIIQMGYNHQKFNMLGLESDISIEEQVSRLSLCSNASQLKRDKNISTHGSSTMNSEGLASANSNNNAKNEKIKQLRQKMQNISKQQQAMDARMRGYAELLQKQLKKKEEQNCALEAMIADLKQELSESRGDLEIITCYLTKSQYQPKQQSKNLRNSNLNNYQIENVLVKKNDNNGLMNKNGKSISPRPKPVALDKLKNQSPQPKQKQEKKLSFSGALVMPLQRKIRSPAK